MFKNGTSNICLTLRKDMTTEMIQLNYFYPTVCSRLLEILSSAQDQQQIFGFHSMVSSGQQRDVLQSSQLWWLWHCEDIHLWKTSEKIKTLLKLSESRNLPPDAGTWWDYICFWNNFSLASRSQNIKRCHGMEITVFSHKSKLLFHKYQLLFPCSSIFLKLK